MTLFPLKWSENVSLANIGAKTVKMYALSDKALASVKKNSYFPSKCLYYCYYLMYPCKTFIWGMQTRIQQQKVCRSFQCESELILILSCHDISWLEILYVKFVVGKFRVVEVLFTTFLKLWKIHLHYCLRHNIKRTLGPKTIKSFDSSTIENQMIVSKFLSSS